MCFAERSIPKRSENSICLPTLNSGLMETEVTKLHPIYMSAQLFGHTGNRRLSSARMVRTRAQKYGMS